MRAKKGQRSRAQDGLNELKRRCGAFESWTRKWLIAHKKIILDKEEGWRGRFVLEMMAVMITMSVLRINTYSCLLSPKSMPLK